jgi:hypothetical protein
VISFSELVHLVEVVGVFAVLVVVVLVVVVLVVVVVVVEMTPSMERSIVRLMFFRNSFFPSNFVPFKT